MAAMHDHLAGLHFAASSCKAVTLHGETVLQPEKAYRNLGWLASHGAKPMRVLSELLETEQRLGAARVHATILFFGSARSRFPAEHAALTARAAATADAGAAAELARTAWMAPLMDDVCELARRLSAWSVARADEQADGGAPYHIASGGGPGFMEAANKGASEVVGALSLGLGIELPFETGINRFCSPELTFSFRYFFMRKQAMCYPCRAFICTPGGYGTMDELFEVLTLLQCGKIDHSEHLPVVLFGERFWRTAVNFEALRDFGTISQSDIDRLFFTDSVDAAFAHVTEKLHDFERAHVTAAAAAHARVAAERAAATAAATAARTAFSKALSPTSSESP